MEQKVENGMIDYSYFLNKVAGRRKPGLTRELTKRHYSAPKGAISLAEGMPNETTFPFECVNVKFKDGTQFMIEGNELASGLQYMSSQGYPPLLEKLKEFTIHAHNPPAWDKSELLMTNGSQDGISKSIEMCLEEGDAVVVHDPLYAGTESAMKPFNPVILGIPQDAGGMIPEAFERILQDWQKKCNANPNLRMPKLLYINPTATNPTGTTIPLERRKRIYDICCKYNILIIEDDPYYYIHFMEQLTPSFLSMDVEGRVLRLDSLSKVLCPGLRIAWVTGPKKLVQNLEMHIQSSYLHSSSLAQVIAYRLLKQWNYDRFYEHLDSVRDLYRKRRDITITAMEKHLKGLAEWNVPSGGMFVWIKVIGVPDVFEMLMTRGLNKLVSFVPGHIFMSDPTKPCSYIRASFSKASTEQIDKAMQLLAELIKEERELLAKK